MGAGLEFLRSRQRFGIRPGLERTRVLLELAGEPHRKFPSVLVGGTNGKGSTCAFVTAILSSAGYRVGTYSSPHLVNETERICINGQPISSTDLNDHLNWAMEATDRLDRDYPYGPPTHFEIVTAVAFRHFALAQVDCAVVEVGLGGRWDATNTLDPLVSVITGLSLDHTDRLGPDLFSIAAEKLPIARQRRPLVTAERRPALLGLFEETALRLNSPLTLVGRDVTWQVRTTDPEGTDAIFSTRRRTCRVRLGLAGTHQLPNFGCALAVAERLADMGWRIDGESIMLGAVSAFCPGRLQIVPPPGGTSGPTVILDGAHNPAGGSVLARALTTLFRFRRLLLVVGMLKDKDAEGFLARLAPLADVIYCVEPPSERALPADHLSRLLSGHPAVRSSRDPLTGLYTALQEAGENDLVCVTGSLYVVGAVLDSDLKRIRQPAGTSVPKPDGFSGL